MALNLSTERVSITDPLPPIYLSLRPLPSVTGTVQVKCPDRFHQCSVSAPGILQVSFIRTGEEESIKCIHTKIWHPFSSIPNVTESPSQRSVCRSSRPSKASTRSRSEVIEYFSRKDPRDLRQCRAFPLLGKEHEDDSIHNG